ncbi:MAG: amino acid ABC transporter substrate-binding protein, partial [Thermodesulfobacteriota bacterium]|nr:amino acid ABC transporter substrate-binding protein [Thermodesulfobacteriota bacterium]
MKNSGNKETPGTKKVILLISITITVGIVMILLAVFHNPGKNGKVSYTAAQKEAVEPVSPLPEKPDRSEILFGCSIGKSGRYISEGQRVIEGYDLWVEKVNNEGGLKVGDKQYPVQIIYYDDEGNGDKTRENIVRLINEDKVDFLLGPYSSCLTLAASEIAEQYGKILVETCGASEVIFSKNTRSTFGILTSASWYTRGFFMMMSQKTSENLTYAVLAFTSKDKLFPKSVAKGARIWGGKVGFKEIYYKVIDTKSDNWIIFLEELREKSPDIVFFTGHYQDAVLLVELLHKTPDYHPKAVVMTLGPTQKDFVKDLGQKAEYMIGVSQWSSKAGYKGPFFGSSQEYAKIFEKTYGDHPTYQNAQATAGCLIYQLAIEKCNTLDAQLVLENIRSLDVELFYGKIRFDKRGLSIGHPMVVVQI